MKLFTKDILQIIYIIFSPFISETSDKIIITKLTLDRVDLNLFLTHF
jgi:hypothetical protein